jgi:hypothetical protein
MLFILKIGLNENKVPVAGFLIVTNARAHLTPTFPALSLPCLAFAPRPPVRATLAFFVFCVSLVLISSDHWPGGYLPPLSGDRAPSHLRRQNPPWMSTSVPLPFWFRGPLLGGPKAPRGVPGSEYENCISYRLFLLLSFMICFFFSLSWISFFFLFFSVYFLCFLFNFFFLFSFPVLFSLPSSLPFLLLSLPVLSFKQTRTF